MYGYPNIHFKNNVQIQVVIDRKLDFPYTCLYNDFTRLFLFGFVKERDPGSEISSAQHNPDNHSWTVRLPVYKQYLYARVLFSHGRKY